MNYQWVVRMNDRPGVDTGLDEPRRTISVGGRREPGGTTVALVVLIDNIPLNHVVAAD